MRQPRPDLGPRLRRVLFEQRTPPPHNIPVHTELGAQIRRGFLSPASGRTFAACDFDQLEARVLACASKRELHGLIYGARGIRPTVRRIFEADRHVGGTRKIADLPRVCTSAQHDPPSMMVYDPGVWEHVCPACGNRQVFTVAQPML